MVSPMISFHHVSDIARVADIKALAGTGPKVVISESVTAGVSKDAAFQMFAKGLADIKLWGGMVALPSAGKLKSGLDVLGYRAIRI